MRLLNLADLDLLEHLPSVLCAALPVVPPGFAGPYLKAEALALTLHDLAGVALPGQEPLIAGSEELQQQLELQRLEEEQQKQAADLEADRVREAGAVAPTPAVAEALGDGPGPEAAKFTASGSRVPKWMKLGK